MTAASRIEASDLRSLWNPPADPEPMSLAEAHRAALARAWLYGGEPCVVATAWNQVAKRRPPRVTHPHFFHEAYSDACASEDPHLLLAVRTIALAQAERCDAIGSGRAARIAHDIRAAVGIPAPS